MDKHEIKPDKYEQLVASILVEQSEPPAFLLPKITLAIIRRRRFWAGLEVFGSVVLSAVSATGLSLAGGELVRQLAQAGTFRILSLLFSDFMVVLANWQSFALSFAESFPVWPAILTLGGLALLLVSFKFMFDNLPKLSWRVNLNNGFNY